MSGVGAAGPVVAARDTVSGESHKSLVARFGTTNAGFGLPEHWRRLLCPLSDPGMYHAALARLEMDRRRIEWAAGDLVENRPALSRWHPDYEAAFAAFMAKARD